MERERKKKASGRAGKKRGETGKEDKGTPAHAPLSERLEQARVRREERMHSTFSTKMTRGK